MANVRVPNIILQNELGLDIASNVRGSSVYITYMKYTMDDDDEDKCILRLQSKSIDNLKNAGIVYDSPLRISWGYIGEMVSPIIVYVRDIKTVYDEDIIYSELNCTDLSSYLKSVKTQGTGKVSILEYLKLFVEDKYRATIKYNGKIIWQSYSKLLPGQYPGINPYTGYKGILSPNKIDPQEQFKPNLNAPMVSAEPEPIGYFDDTSSADKLGQFLNTPIDIVSANMSPSQVLRNVFRQAPDGPWFITGGGNRLQIHNRNLRNTPLTGYTYRSNSSFLNFTITTKREVSDANTLSYTTIDPTTKIIRSRESYIQSLKGLKPLSQVVNDKVITEQDKKDNIKRLLESYMGYLNYGVVRNTLMTKEPFQDILSKEKGYKGRYIPKDAPPSDQLSAIINNLTVAGYIYSSPLDSPDADFDTMNNVAKEIEMGRIESDLKVVGNIDLMPDRIISLNGLLPEHNGNWYIKNAEHEISTSGYITTCESFLVNDKNSQSIFKTETEIKLDGEGEDLEKRFVTEKKLFNELNNLKILIGTTTLSGTPGNYYLPNMSPTELTNYKSVEEILQTGGIDVNQDIERILKSIEQGNYVLNNPVEE